jgi:hypothetical protein
MAYESQPGAAAQRFDVDNVLRRQPEPFQVDMFMIKPAVQRGFQHARLAAGDDVLDSDGRISRPERAPASANIPGPTNLKAVAAAHQVDVVHAVLIISSVIVKAMSRSTHQQRVSRIILVPRYLSVETIKASSIDQKKIRFILVIL